MDTAYDVFNSDDGSDVTPLREALSTMLHSRAVRLAEHSDSVNQIDKVLAALTKLEKLRAHAAPRSASPRESALTRHHVELSIAPARVPHLSSDQIVSVTAEPLPSSDSTADNAPQKSDAA